MNMCFFVKNSKLHSKTLFLFVTFTAAVVEQRLVEALVVGGEASANHHVQVEELHGSGACCSH